MSADILLTAIPMTMLGGGCAMLVASHVMRVRFRHIRREEIAANNLLRAEWADKKVNSGSWALGTWGLATAILGFVFLIVGSRSVAINAVIPIAGATFVLMSGLRVWDVLHPTEPRKEPFGAQVAARLSSKRPAKQPLKPADAS